MEAAIHNFNAFRGEACSPLTRCVAWVFGRAPLILVLLLISPTQLWSAGRDTITVDGVALELELDIRNSDAAGAGVNDNDRGKVRRLGPGRADFCLGLGAGWIFHPSNALGNRLSQYTGKWGRWSTHVPLAAEWQVDSRLIRMELGLENYRDWAYDSAVLDDQLFQLAPDDNGGVEQWVAVNVGELGIELDTLPLPTFTYSTSSAMMAVSLGSAGRRRSYAGSVAPLHWWAGFHGRWIWDNRADSHVNRIPDNMLPSSAQVTGPARNDWEANQSFIWGLQFGMSKGIRKSPWEWMASGQLVAGPLPRFSCMLGVQYRWTRNRR